MTRPTLQLELEARLLDGITQVAGLDEAGRGALAGPVVAAAVILPLHDAEQLKLLAGANDSKQLTARQRETLFDLIIAHALAYGIGSASNSHIDSHGIISGTKLAMQRALEQLTTSPDYLLIDGRIRLNQVNIPQKSIIRGDSKSLSIAAASILAKVSRDRAMVGLDGEFPAYGFAQHKGYGTARHLAALTSHGPCACHRHSFAPIRQPLL